MATPEAPRPPEMGMARVLGKGAPGQQLGRMTGLSPVPRRGNARVRQPAPEGAEWVYPDPYYSATWTGSLASGATLDTRTSAPSSTDDQSDLVVLDGSVVEPTADGLYLVNWSLSLSGASGGAFQLDTSTGASVCWSDSVAFPSVASNGSQALESGGQVYAVVANRGPAGPVTYTLNVLVQPILIP